MSITTLYSEVDLLKPTFSRTLILVAVLCVSFTAVQAAEVRLADGQLIVTGVDDSIGLGAFSVVLSYESDVSVISVKGLSGFMVAENIRNDERKTFVAGISANGLTGDVPVASVEIEGAGPITISVRELGNARGDPIPFTNPEFRGTIPTPGPSTSGSVPGSGSVTPASTQISLPTTTTVPTGTPQLAETGTTPALTAEATSTARQESRTESQGTPGKGAVAESTPKAALPAMVALVAVLTVIILKRKD